MPKFPGVISRKRAFAVIDWILRTDNGEKIVIHFYGGEALTEFPLMKKIIKYTVSNIDKNKRIFWGIRTNLTLLNEKIMDFLKKHGFAIATSIDGNEETHNSVRVMRNGAKSYRFIKKNIPILLKYNPYAQVNCMISKDNVSRTFEMVISLVKDGFKNIAFAPNFHDDWNQEQISVLEGQVKKLSQYYLECFMNNTDMHFEAFDKPISQYINNKPLWCNGGIQQFAIDIYGNILPCVYFYNLKDPALIMGNVFHGGKIKKTIRHRYFNTVKICKVCDIKHRCHRACFGRNYLVTGSYYKTFSLACEYTKMLINTSDSVADILYKNKNAVFLNKFYKDKPELLKESAEFVQN